MKLPDFQNYCFETQLLKIKLLPLDCRKARQKCTKKIRNNQTSSRRETAYTKSEGRLTVESTFRGGYA